MNHRQITLVQESWRRALAKADVVALLFHMKLLASGDPAGLVPVVEALRRSDRHQAAADALLRLLERGLDKGKAA